MKVLLEPRQGPDVAVCKGRICFTLVHRIHRAIGGGGLARARVRGAKRQRKGNPLLAGMKFEGRPTWVEVKLGQLLRNLRAIRRHVNPPGTRPRRMILAVVKGNAYGHGAVPVAKALEKAGTEWLGVASPAEGAELRESGIRAHILVMTGFWTGEEHTLLEHKLTAAVSGLEQLRRLERAAARAAKRRGPVGFHLKVDSGMNRLGITPEQVPEFVRALANSPHLRLEGVFTHFASSDAFLTKQTEEQQARFHAALKCLRALGVAPGIVHLANSAAIGARPETWADMVRPGAVLYGYHQFYDVPEKKAEVEAALPLRPALSLRTRIVTLRDVPVGGAVGYNARWTATRPSRVAVIAAGYADGLLRSLTNRGRVIIRGQFAPLVGTISMDLAAVDVTDIEGARTGDVVTIYGADGDAVQWASDVARVLGTVSSDLLCLIGHRVPRLYLR